MSGKHEIRFRFVVDTRPRPFSNYATLINFTMVFAGNNRIGFLPILGGSDNQQAHNWEWQPVTNAPITGLYNRCANLLPFSSFTVAALIR
jgi:hypothetical protein